MHSAVAHHFESLEKQGQAQRLGMWLFLATEVLLFTALFAAYGVYRYLYTVKGKNRRTALLFGLSILMGCVFMVLKGIEYRHHFLHAELPGQFYGGPIAGSGGSMFFALYFLITGLHAFHVLVGMTVLGVIGARAWMGKYDAQYHVPVELAGLYWHLVDLIWIFVFPLIYLI
jgi:cytochrome c oxidase subunit 3